MCLNVVLIIIVVSVRIGYAMRLGLDYLNSWRSAWTV